MIHKILSVLLLPVSWPIYLLSYLTPRHRDLIVFGVQTSSFSGNVKSLLTLPDPLRKKVFIGKDRREVASLRKAGLLCFWKYSPRGVYLCLRAGSYVYSSYPSDINFWLSGGAHKINVWHGTPLKKIERDIDTGPYALRNRLRFLYELIAPYLFSKPDRMLVSSRHEEEVFASAFKLSPESIVRGFPPRLTTFQHTKSRVAVKSSILYVPTWRDTHSFSISEHLEFGRLSRFLEQHSMELFIKRHPSDKSVMEVGNNSSIKVIPPDQDVYEALAGADLVITDYSSMMFDALYVDIPVVLFTPDENSYSSQDRSMYFNAETELGLRKAKHQDALQQLLLNSMQHKQQLKLPARFEPFAVNDDLLEDLVRESL